MMELLDFFTTDIVTPSLDIALGIMSLVYLARHLSVIAQIQIRVRDGVMEVLDSFYHQILVHHHFILAITSL